MSLLEYITLGNFLFTAGAYLYIWRVERKVSNHHEGRLRKVERLMGLREDE